MDQRTIGVMGLLMLLALAQPGCGTSESHPTAVLPLPTSMRATPEDAARVPESRAALWRRPVIAEAGSALGGVLSAEQAYDQRLATFTDISVPSDFARILGVILGDALERWDFSVSGASTTGFLAVARGREHSRARGLIVTLRYVRGEPPHWTLERVRPAR